MSDFELSDLSLTDELRSEDTPSCWHCEEENARFLRRLIELQFLRRLKELQNTLCWNYRKNSKGNLIRPCTCANKFIHVHCLELLANTRNLLDCPRCLAQYPLEMQPESLLKMLQKVYAPVSMILFSIFVNFISGLIVYAILSIDVWNLISIIVKIIILSIFLFSIYMTVCKIIDWSRRIYQLYNQWYNSTEWKLIKRYNVNIENI